MITIESTVLTEVGALAFARIAEGALIRVKTNAARQLLLEVTDEFIDFTDGYDKGVDESQITVNPNL